MKKQQIAIILCCALLSFTGCNNASDNNENAEEYDVSQEETKVFLEEIPENANKKSTVIDPGVGEGTTAMELADLSESMEYKVGDVILIETEDCKYELKIDAVSYTEERNDHAEETENVVLVDYTYRCLSGEQLMIGDIRFQLTNGTQDKVYAPYYYSELIVPEMIDAGESASAQAAFVKDDDSTELMIVYTESSDTDSSPILICVEDIGV